MLYSIAMISLVNCLTIKEFGEKCKDNKDLSLFKKLKDVYPDLARFERTINRINDIKNASEYGDNHFQRHDGVDLKKLERFIDFVQEKTG